MKYLTYFNLACKRFPNMNFDKIPPQVFGRIELIRKVAECLFIEEERHSELADETRLQLKNLIRCGIINFE